MMRLGCPCFGARKPFFPDLERKVRCAELSAGLKDERQAVSSQPPFIGRSSGGELLTQRSYCWGAELNEASGKRSTTIRTMNTLLIYYFKVGLCQTACLYVQARRRTDILYSQPDMHYVDTFHLRFGS